MRLFAALPIPQDLTTRLEALQKGVLGASWRPPENFHITLRYFGELDHNLAQDLDAELGEIRTKPYELRLSGAGFFGRREPTTLWIGVAESEALRNLSAKCERVARRVGLPPDRHPYTPHVTLAYCHGTSPTDASEFQMRNAAFQSAAFWCDRFHLYSSHMGKGASRYIDEAEYPLG